jgi:hypothetical protein
VPKLVEEICIDSYIAIIITGNFRKLKVSWNNTDFLINPCLKFTDEIQQNPHRYDGTGGK